MAHINFENVTIRYPIYNTKSMSLRNRLVQIGTGGLISKDASDVVSITAIENANFRIKEGERIGLIGHNGAGKTTLLRTMAGIFQPESGVVDIRGRISTIIELGAGMDVELSGYENIFRIGMLLGSSKKEIDSLIPSIEEFCELGDFLSVPVRTYSSGMMMRLMFAVGTATRPEILLVDEMFGTGDIAFQEKAQKRMIELIDSAKIFVFSSHSQELINKFCQRVFTISHGRLIEQ
jgi:ABC-type polysaccharide/polyol phosphate transport system ATPase subunit